jgi:hypothetical protein
MDRKRIKLSVKTSPIRLKRVSREGTKESQRRQPFPKQSTTEVNLSLAKRTLKSLKAPWACNCSNQCRSFIH